MRVTWSDIGGLFVLIGFCFMLFCYWAIFDVVLGSEYEDKAIGNIETTVIDIATVTEDGDLVIREDTYFEIVDGIVVF